MPHGVRHAVTEPRQNGRCVGAAVGLRRDTNQNNMDAGRMPTGMGQTNTVPGCKTLRANIMIASLNINRGGMSQTRAKWQHIDQLLRNKKIGILAVQETHLCDPVIDSLHAKFHQRVHIINSSVPEHPNTMGVAIVLNKNLVAWKEAVTYELVPGLAILVSVPWYKDSKINMLAIYMLNQEAENKIFWDLLKEKWLTNDYPKPDVLLGDFNCVEADINCLPLNQNALAAAKALEEYKLEIGMVDGWR